MGQRLGRRQHLLVLRTRVGSVTAARQALAEGADGLIVQGVEAGGHVLATEPLRTLLPRVRDLVADRPVLAAGALTDAAEVRRPHPRISPSRRQPAHRHSPRNRAVAGMLQAEGMATLLIDLLTVAEEQRDVLTGELRFDLGLLADRVVAVVRWASHAPLRAALPIGLFGASTGGGAALVAAARLSDAVRAVVSRGGRPDLAGDALPLVRCPVLLLVGERDEQVVRLNQQAGERLTAALTELVIVPRATHLFEEPGALQQVAGLAADWFRRHLAVDGPRQPALSPDPLT